MTIWWVSGILGFLGGGTFIWFTKDYIQKLVIGANELSKRLHAKADQLSK